MKNHPSMVGLQFGRFTVLRMENKGKNFILWLCRCECGNEKAVRGNHLRAGRTQSCGCLSRDMTIARASIAAANCKWATRREQALNRRPYKHTKLRRKKVHTNQEAA